MKLKKQFCAALTAFGMLLCTLPQPAPSAGAAETVMYSGVTGLPFENGDPFKGADVSSVISLEESGVKFCDRNGNERDIFLTLADAGVNTIRVRIWNNPYQTGTHANYGGGVCDLPCAVKIAERCANAGLKLLVDFHYSDFWADPGKQKAPKAWASYSVSQKADAIYQFTLDSLRQISAAGAEIAMVQVGNETTTGMCGVMLEDYGWSDAGWRDLASLFNAGSRAVRDFSSDTLVALHFTNPEKASNMTYLADMLRKTNVDYDVFATSYYPYWHGTLSNLTSVLTNISRTSGKRVMVAETSCARTLDDRDTFPNTIGSRDALGDYAGYELSPAGQTAYLHDIFAAVAAVPDGKGIGVFYWEPAWLAVGTDSGSNAQKWEKYGSGWANSAAGEYDKSAQQSAGGSCIENESLFSDDGRPLDSLYVFGTVHGSGGGQHPQGENLLRNGGFEANGGWTDSPEGWTLDGTADGHFDVRAEDSHSGGCALHWYSERAFADSTASTVFRADADGTYRISGFVQGDEATRYALTVTSGQQQKQITGTGRGWAVWQEPSAELTLRAGETVRIMLTVSGGAGSYGSADDFRIQKTAEPADLRGDLNLDGAVNRQDAGILLAYLLGSGTAPADRADLNADGKLNAADLTILKQIAGVG